MRPGVDSTRVGYPKPAPFEVFFAAWLDQNQFVGGAPRFSIVAIVDAAIGDCYGTFSNATLVGVALVPENRARLKIETNEVAGPIAAVTAIKRAVPS